jgi:hypothetical protein
MPTNKDVLDATDEMNEAGAELVDVPNAALMTAYAAAEFFKAGELVEMIFGKPKPPKHMLDLGHEIIEFAVGMKKTVKVSNDEEYSNKKRLDTAKHHLDDWIKDASINAKAVGHLKSAKKILA